MSFCTKCGTEVPEGVPCCPNCGTPMSAQATNYQSQSQDVKYNGMNTTALLIWSIFNLICCCLPLGVVGLVFTLTAKNGQSLEEQQGKLKNAFICNIIATIVGVIAGFISFFFGFFGALA